MKKSLVKAISVIFAFVLFFNLNVFAEQPEGYWRYFERYTKALESGDVNEILNAGDELLSFYSQFQINYDIAAMSYNIYHYRYKNAIFEKMGKYDLAMDNCEKLAYYAEYLGFTDMVIAANAKKKKIDPMTEVYAISNNGANFGAKYEPKSGTYYGRVADLQDTYVKNVEAISNEAIVSFYIELGQNTAEDFSWIIDQYDNGGHLIHIAMNFPGEANTPSEILSGKCDDNIKKTLSYISKLKSPVLLRIGGEMNLWDVDPNEFKNAFIKVADLARSMAPNAAIVWSPNHVGAWGSSVEEFYPGDFYVDWIGMSLYTNSEVKGDDRYSDDSMYFGRGAFSDPILSAREVAEFAEEHSKPVIVTEGGTGIISNLTNENLELDAGAKISKVYSSLNMVYPNIKAIIYFDTDLSYEKYRYSMSNSSFVRDAYNRAVKNNPTLISKAGGSSPSYVKLSQFNEKTDIVKVSAYSKTLYSDKMNVNFVLTGRTLEGKSGLPYECEIDTLKLVPGSFEFKVIFDDTMGYRKEKVFTLIKTADGVIKFVEGYDPTSSDAPSEWALEEVMQAVNNNLVMADLQHNYTKNINRLDFCRLVINLIEQKTDKSIDDILKEKNIEIDNKAFKDTNDKNALAANALQIVGGRGDGIFDCASDITREEAAKMLKNAADILGVKAQGNGVNFSDEAEFSPWAVEHIKFISAVIDNNTLKPVMGGVGDNRFDPKGKYTYQQAFITMLRLYRA